MKKLQAWLNAFRLPTLPLAFSSIITGSALAYKQMHVFNAKVFGLSLITTLLLQVLSNLANDYGDSQKGTDNDERIGPKRAIQSGMLSFKEVKYGIAVCAILSLLSGVALIAEASKGMHLSMSVFFLLLGLSAIVAAIKYTVGKNAYGYQGLGDMFVVLFFGWVGVEGSYYLQTKQFSAGVLLPATTIGVLAATVLHLNNMRDRVSDEKSGKITVAVRLGFEKSKHYFYWLNFVSFSSHIVFCLWANWKWWQCTISTLPFAVLFITCLQVYQAKQPKQFDPLLKVNALATFFLSLSIALV
jgi:1,4-dihydroxy-2-naphthoate octaprenyltransferase